MSNQTKFLISMLFIVVIILCVGLTKFYLDATKNSEISDDETKIEAIVRTCDNGMQVFEGVNGFYGILDKEGNVLIEPEWMEILYAGEKMAVVSKRLNGQVLIGGIDYEENVVLPFAFHSMEFVDDAYCIASAAKDGSCLVYTMDFRPVFQMSWESVSYANGMLDLTRDGCQFSYYIAESPWLFRRAQMQCAIGSETLFWNVANKIYLSELSPEDLLHINQCVTAYMEMLMQNDFQDLESISGSEYLVGLSLHDSFNGYDFEEVKDFSFSYSDPENKVYDFAFSIVCRANGEYQWETAAASDADVPPDQTVRMNLYFRRDRSNTLILTAAAMDFQGRTSSEPVLPTEGE